MSTAAITLAGDHADSRPSGGDTQPQCPSLIGIACLVSVVIGRPCTRSSCACWAAATPATPTSPPAPAAGPRW